MAVLLQIDFPFDGPFGKEMHQAMEPLAQSISEEPGFFWKIWTENEATHEAGGIYLFENQEIAEKYLEKHSKRLTEAGIKNIRARFFLINQPLSAITRADWL